MLRGNTYGIIYREYKQERKSSIVEASSLFVSFVKNCEEWDIAFPIAALAGRRGGRTAVAFFKIHGMMYLKNLKLKISRRHFRAVYDGIAA